MSLKKDIHRLADIFAEMVKNYSSMGDGWKNLSLVKDAFALMQSLPDTLPGEYETPAEKGALLSQMLYHVDETQAARFCIKVREEIARLSPDDTCNQTALTMLKDYIDESIPMEDFCKKHNRLLKFDPAERSAEYEAVIPEVEKAVAKELKDHVRGMGFCFAYWAAKRAELANRGLEWNSPSCWNPGVMFD